MTRWRRGYVGKFNDLVFLMDWHGKLHQAECYVTIAQPQSILGRGHATK